MAITADKRLYLTADRKRIVEAGDPDAAFLWKPAGDEITDDEAVAFGLAEAKPQRDANTPPRRGRPPRNAESVDADAEEKAEAPEEDKSA